MDPGDYLHSWQRWPDDRDGPWLVGLHLAPIDDRFELVGFEMWAASPPGGRRRDLQDAHTISEGLPTRPIRAGDFRRVAIDTLARDALARHGRTSRFIARHPERFRTQTVRSARRIAKRAGSGRGRAGRPAIYDEEHYAEVAEVYTDALARRRPPTQAVAAYFDYTPTKAAKHVQRARDQGFDLKAPGTAGQFQPRRRGIGS